MDCAAGECNFFLDGSLQTPEPIAADFPNLENSEILVHLGYGAEWEGKIQKIQIGSGAAEIDGTEAVTNCGVEIRKINEALEIQTIPAEVRKLKIYIILLVY